MVPVRGVKGLHAVASKEIRQYIRKADVTYNPFVNNKG